LSNLLIHQMFSRKLSNSFSPAVNKRISYGSPLHNILASPESLGINGPDKLADEEFHYEGLTEGGKHSQVTFVISPGNSGYAVKTQILKVQNFIDRNTE
jgi:hypothetical protein